MERLTEKRDGQNVIPLRQNGKIKWAICSAGLGDAPTEYLYGDHADRLAAIEDILGDEYDLDLLQKQIQAYREGRYIILKEPEQAGVSLLRELAKADREGRCMVLPEGGCEDKDGENALKSAMHTCFYHNNPVTRFIADAVAEKLTRQEAEAALRREQDGNNK